MFDRNYLMNPFKLKTSTEEELSDVIDQLSQMYNYDDDTMGVISDNIQIECDLLVVYGELIARYERDHDLTKLDADINESRNIYQLRKDWVEMNTEKPPAMSYFEAQAEEKVKPLRTRQIELKSMLNRFKMAWDSMDKKQQALKRKQDTIKYEGA